MRTQFSNNTGQHINRIVTSTSCGKHRVAEGLPCYTMHPFVKSNAFDLIGVCGARIKKAGFTGVISPASLRLNAPGGRNEQRRARS